MLYFLRFVALALLTNYSPVLATDLDNHIIEEVSNKLKSAKPFYDQIINNIERKTAQYQEYAKSLVQGAKQAQEKQKAETLATATPKPSGIVEQLLSNYQQMQESKCQQSNKAGFRIFVSFSMPKELLLKLDQQARQIGTKLVIRGLKDNSFKETIAYIKALNEQGMVIDIDPKAFEQFSINHVPSFVISDGSNYDKLVGNVSIPYVLNKFAEEGDLKQQAAGYFQRLSNASN